MSKKDEALEMAQELRALADRFSEGWHEGIKIDALDIELLAMAASAIEQPAQPYKGIADHINHATNGRVKIDPVTGNVSIGAQFPPAQQQEPVAYCNDTAIERLRDEPGDWMLIYGKPQHPHKVPLYAAPPASKPLNWTPIQEFWRNNSSINWDELETAIREALAEQPAQQEPVYVRDEATGYMYTVLSQFEQEQPVAKVCHDLDGHIGWNPKLTELPDEGTLLYTSPPASKPWVGLTDEEAQKTFHEHNCVISADLAGILARAIEAKLREKNA